MCDEDMVDHTQLGKTEFTHTGAGVDQHVVIEQERGGAQIATDSPAASQHSEFHTCPVHPENFIGLFQFSLRATITSQGAFTHQLAMVRERPLQ